MRFLTTLLATLLMATTLSAQDYTHTNEQFEDMSAEFTAMKNTFNMKLGNKELMLMKPKSYQLPDMLTFIDKVNQSLDDPMTAKQLLFAIDALQNWQMKEPQLANTKVIDEYVNEKGFEKHESGLYYKVEKQGDGAKPEDGQTVTVHYKGYLPDGTKFDSSYDRDQPFSFQLGQGRVIQGWDKGIPIFNVGGKGTLLVPSEMGYGARGAGAKIPPNAVLLFDIEVIDVE
ncbi:MAG: FKBP-type peptidyl-prolyl cis-trans isomerase [Bacteroidota bacterium]